MNFAERQNPTGRLIGIGVAVLLHIVIIYALVTGLARQAVEVLKAPIETKIIEEPKIQPPPPPPPPPPPDFKVPPPPFVPLPEVQIQQPPPPKAITVAPSEKPPPAQAFTPTPPPQAKPAEAVRTEATLNGSARCEKPPYPKREQEYGIGGTVQIQVLVGPDGHVRQGQIRTSSGHAALDQAALSGFSQCVFTPGTENGKPIDSWLIIPYRFNP